MMELERTTFPQEVGLASSAHAKYQIRRVDVKRARFVCRTAQRSRLITP
jgi:hypothetical protein